MEILGGAKVHLCKFFPPKGYTMITLFGHLIFRGTKKDFEEFFDSPECLKIINHEKIHILQGNKLGWFKFYYLYIKYYLKARIYIWKNKDLNSYIKEVFPAKNSKHKWAYKRIPFELEAFANEHNLQYSETHWETYILETIYGPVK